MRFFVASLLISSGFFVGYWNSGSKNNYRPPFVDGLQSSSELSFSAPSVVYNSPHLQLETPLVSHPENDNIFAASAITNVYPGGYTTGFYRTTDGGISWSGTDAIKTQSGSIISTVGDPLIAITDSSRYIIAYIAGRGGASFGLGVSYSTNSGVSWTPTYFIPDVNGPDKPAMKIDQFKGSPNYGNCYIVYSAREGIFFSRSLDDGTTWSSPKRISPRLQNNRTGVSIATGPQGEIYVTWPININLRNYIGFARSTNGGSSWESNDMSIESSAAGSGFQLILNTIKVNGLPAIDVDKSGGPDHGSLYITYAEDNDDGSPSLDTCDLVISKSTDRGLSWQPKRLINKESSEPGNYQVLAQLDVDKRGNVNVLYYDTRDTPTDDSLMVFFSRSTDGGNTFSDTRISDMKFVLKRLPREQILFGIAYYLGSYIGLASSNSRIVTFWSADYDGQYRAYSSWAAIPAESRLSLKVFPSGIYRSGENILQRPDSIELNVREQSSPFNIVKHAAGILDTVSGTAILELGQIQPGSYYLEAKHKNSITVWSSQPMEILHDSNSYDFTDSLSKCYGSNLLQSDLDPVVYAMYSGDVNSDGIIDVTDASLISNDAANFVSGNVLTDLTGDNFVDISDYAIADFGSKNYITVITP
ncbi:MAG: exo-alpha-sialidase [Ignavibacteria bacterium]|nr:exo-alpha-sialidase [Ignavibacteria bacterium]